MNPRNTWLWLLVAAGLFAAIFFYEKHGHRPLPGTTRVLPELKADAVTSVQVRPAAGHMIQAERTNGVWQLTEPSAYPAQKGSIEGLLTALEKLTPVTVITARELMGKTNADEEYGFATPQATITLQQPDFHALVQVGARTAPGDQVFVRVVSDVYVVDAGILKYLPGSADDWRDTTLLDLKTLAFDHLSITNGAKIVQLVRGGTNEPWRMVYPLSARADNLKISEALRRLESLRVQQFVPDDVKGDLDAYGLQTPELELAFGLGTNPPTVVQFGKSPTNDTRLVYARRAGQNAVVTVASNLLAPWRENVNDFRDPYLLSLKAPPALTEVRGQENFTLEQQTNGAWRVLPQGFAADADLVKDVFSALNTQRIIEFIDVVIEPDLPNYGLAAPTLRYSLMSGPAITPAGRTNPPIADLSFGTNQSGKVFARRADESFVYGITSNDFHRLPSAGWQLRDRTIWDFSTNDIARVIIHQQGKERQIKRNGPYNWALITPGVLKNDLAVEETVRCLCQLTASAWVAHGEHNRAAYGFADKGFQITLELKSGDKKTVEFGGEAPSGCPYAVVTLDDSPWIFEFPLTLFRDVASYLTIPADVP
jgi:hypothetical protein